MTQSTKKIQYESAVPKFNSYAVVNGMLGLHFHTDSFFYLTGHNCKFSLSFLTSIIRKIGKNNNYLSQNYPAENCVFIFDFNL